MILTKQIEGLEIEFHVDYYPEEGSRSSTSTHYFAGSFELTGIYFNGAEISDLLGENRCEELEEDLADAFYNTDEFSPY